MGLDNLSKYLIGSCVNKDDLKNAEHKMACLENNRQLANDVSCIVEEVQSHLSIKLKLPFKDLDNSLSFAATDEENELENFARYEKFVVRVMSETSDVTAKRIIQAAATNFGVYLHDTSIKR